MSRFVPIIKIAWLIAKRKGGMPKDLRRHFVRNYVAKHLFNWETQDLRDERIRQRWVAEDYKIPFSILRHHIDRVEHWDRRDNDGPDTKFLRMHRLDTFMRGTLWVWVYDEVAARIAMNFPLLNENNND